MSVLLAEQIIIPTFAAFFVKILFYGVMVTRQILVLKFKVRVLVEQHFSNIMKLNEIEKHRNKAHNQ